MSIKEKIHILVVDDMSTSRGLIIQALEEIGIKNIHHAADASQALAVISKTKIHIILSDYNMPHITGIQLLNAIRSNPSTKSTGFILITGRADKTIIDTGKSLGMNNFIKKPFTTSELKLCLESVTGSLN
ncbi:response regulator [Paracoccus cavernae]|uniref:response regulator n=1 Tax=Paracoccus cavernae TaxID=1571207 RepID=UPI0035F27D7A